MDGVLLKLAQVLEQRKSASSGTYVAALHAGGLEGILEKVSEEAGKPLMQQEMQQETQQETQQEMQQETQQKTCKGDTADKAAVIHETADLWFHTLVMLSHLDLGPGQVLEELEKRFNISGLEEKASRKIKTGN